MPTGYTAPIEDLSKSHSFREFVWNCARAFDHWCRDNDGLPPIERAPDISYETRQVANAKTDLANLDSKTDAQVQADLDAAYERSLKDWEDRKTRNDAIHARYVEMRSQIAVWVPPSELHKKLKEFMLEQIHIGHFQYYDPESPYGRRPEKESAAEYRVRLREDLLSTISRNEARIAEIIQRTREINDYFQALNRSVPQP